VRFGSTDNEDCYTSNISCGMPIIININDFYVGDDFSVQADIKLDGNYLRETLLYLGFKVEMHEDLTAAQIVIYLEDALTTDHSNSDCLLIILLSCGNDKDLVYASNQAMSIDYLTSLFKLASKTLSGKPKYLFYKYAASDLFYFPIRIFHSKTLRSQHLIELMKKQVTFVDDKSCYAYETPIGSGGTRGGLHPETI
ncbi:unnamed protein product, partial [Didymodactylos carnosus]